MATPRTHTKRGRDTACKEQTKRNTSVKRASKRMALNDATPQAHSAQDLCTAMSTASLASGDSEITRVIKKLPQSILAPSTRDTPDFHATTSPRLESRLARRPQPQFPYSIQPFQLLPASPEERMGVSVQEANRRIQQARALSDRQQQFGQLLDLASAGYIPAHQCGDGQAQQVEENSDEPQATSVSPVASNQAVDVSGRSSPEPSEINYTQAEALPQSQVLARNEIASASASTVPAVTRRLTRLEPVKRALTLRHGEGSIRILRMNQ